MDTDFTPGRIDSLPNHGLNRPALKWLTRLGSCPEGLEWVKDRTVGEMWVQCDRPDWLLWLAERLGADPKLVWRATVMAMHAMGHDFTPVWVLHAMEACAKSGFEDRLSGLAVAAHLRSGCCLAAFRSGSNVTNERFGLHHAADQVRAVISLEALGL
jgi:hypothetical protein